MGGLSLRGRFAAVRDTREVPDPWGFGITFTIGRVGREAYQDHVTETNASNAGVVAYGEAQLRGQLTAEANKVPLDEAVAAELRAAAARLHMPPVEVLRAYKDATIDGYAKHLLVGWVGMTDEAGAPQAYSVAAARELLTATEWVEAGLPYSGWEPPAAVDDKPPDADAWKAWREAGSRGPGRTLGAAMQAFVLYEAGRGELYRAGYVEAAAKNSETSSAGSELAG